MAIDRQAPPQAHALDVLHQRLGTGGAATAASQLAALADLPAVVGQVNLAALVKLNRIEGVTQAIGGHLAADQGAMNVGLIDELDCRRPRAGSGIAGARGRCQLGQARKALIAGQQRRCRHTGAPSGRAARLRLQRAAVPEHHEIAAQQLQRQLRVFHQLTLGRPQRLAATECEQLCQHQRDHQHTDGAGHQQLKQRVAGAGTQAPYHAPYHATSSV